MKYLTRLYLIIVAIIIGNNVISQHLNVKIGDSINEFFPEEPCIAIDQFNTDRVIVGANINNYYKSDDGGYTWEHYNLSSPYGVWGDPCIISDNTGAFYYFHLSDPPGAPWVDRIICQKQPNWESAFSYHNEFGWNNYKLQDKEWAAIDRENNIMYVAWTQWDEFGSTTPGDSSLIVLSKSADLGLTWSEPVRLSEIAGDCVGEDNTVEGAVPAIGPAGEVYIAWAGEHGIYFDKSLDNGNTWLENDIHVTDMPGGWYFSIPGLNKANGMPVTACDISDGIYNGNIYINWSDQRNGEDNTDIWLVKSTDKGETWSEPTRINDDLTENHQFLTWMDIDQTNGNIYIVFYDRRNYSDTNTDVYLAVSTDGGESFVNTRISESPFIPYSTVFFGDYTNIAAHNGVIRPVWTRLDGYRLSVYTSIIDNTSIGIDNRSYSPIANVVSYPNPFTESSYISFTLRTQSVVSIKIFDNTGRYLHSLLNDKIVAPGKYVEEFKPHQYSLPVGVYYYQITSNDKLKIGKLVYGK